VLRALDQQIVFYHSAVQIGVNQTAARTTKTMQKHNAVAHRLLDRQDDYLRFTQDWRIPADNNGSERDIRMIKLRQKGSGCLRTRARQFCAIRSYLSTAAKHGKHFFEVLVTLTTGHDTVVFRQGGCGRGRCRDGPAQAFGHYRKEARHNPNQPCPPQPPLDKKRVTTARRGRPA
jgi:hypothetical protein